MCWHAGRDQPSGVALAVFSRRTMSPRSMGVFAEFEGAMIRERVLAGLARAKGRGSTLAVGGELVA